MFQNSNKNTKWPRNTLKFYIPSLRKCNKILIFGMKIDHRATLFVTRRLPRSKVTYVHFDMPTNGLYFCKNDDLYLYTYIISRSDSGFSKENLETNMYKFTILSD
jgi:hypothetical protein